MTQFSLPRPRWPRGTVNRACLGILVVLLGLGLFLRTWQPDLIEFKNDEADAYARAGLMVELGQPVLEGAVSSTGLMNSPITAWSVWPMVVLGASPEAVQVGIGILQVLLLGVLAWQAWRTTGPVSAVVTTAILAAGFWSIFVTRKPTDAAFVPIVSSALLVVTLQWWAWRRPAWLLAVGILAGILVQYHVSSLVLLAPLGVLGLLGLRDGVTRWPWGMAAAAGFLGTTAIVWLRDALRGINSLQFLLGTAEGGERRLDLAPFQQAGQFLFDGGAPFWFGRGSPDAQSALVSTGPLPMLIVGAAILLGATLSWQWWSLRRADRLGLASAGPGQRALLVASVAVFLPLFLLVFRTWDLAIHYLNFLLPWAAFAVGATAGLGWSQPNLRPFGAAIAGAVLITTGIQAVQVTQAIDLVSRVDTTDGFGVPLRFHQQAYREAAAVAGGAPVLVVAAPADQRRVADALARWGGFPVIAMERPATLAAPAGGGVTLVHPEAVQAQLWLRQANPAVTTLPLPGQAVYQLTPGLPGTAADAPLGRFDNGIGIEAVGDALLLDGRLVVPVTWRVENPAAAPPGTRFFAHLVGSDGAIRDQDDGMGWPQARWQAGDRAVTLFSFDPAALGLGTLPREGTVSLPAGTTFQLGMTAPGAGRAQLDARGETRDGTTLVVPVSTAQVVPLRPLP